MLINVSEALDSDTASMITIIRSTVGAYVDGLYVKGTTVNVPALASVQQPTPAMLKLVPENERTTDIKLFICNKPIRTTRNKEDLPADQILDGTFLYKVIDAKDWDRYGHSTVMGVLISG